jgi:7-cyano-7-deazaguanine synthase
MNPSQSDVMALLLSGGLDSSILLSYLLGQGRTVQPIYVRTGTVWQAEELTAIYHYLKVARSPRLRDLINLELPLDDLYGNHWSITGHGTPGEHSEDEAVYLPGRNPLLLVKAAVWCQMHSIELLALAPLSTNPFTDATDRFFATFEEAMHLAGSARLRIVRPFAHLKKREVMQLGRHCPLAHTFSCIAPIDGLHCGHCNKCAERKAAFEVGDLTDPTHYASDLRSTPHERVYL